MPQRPFVSEPRSALRVCARGVYTHTCARTRPTWRSRTLEGSTRGPRKPLRSSTLCLPWGAGRRQSPRGVGALGSETTFFDTLLLGTELAPRPTMGTRFGEPFLRLCTGIRPPHSVCSGRNTGANTKPLARGTVCPQELYAHGGACAPQIARHVGSELFAHR